MILVTGANGNVGAKTVRHLAGTNHKVRALVRDPAKASDLAGIAEVVAGDLGNPRTLAAAFGGVERAFVIAPVTPELETLEANAFQAAAEAGVKHIVKLSNFGSGAFPTSLWHWHKTSENALRRLGVPWTILRPTRFMSDAPFSWDLLIERGPLFEPLGDQPITLIDPHDVAAVAATVLTTDGHDGRIYDLTSAETLTGTQIAQKITAAIGRPVTFADPTPEAFRDTMTAVGLPELFTDLILQYCALVRDGRMRATTTVADLTGRRPRSYDEWLHDNAPTRTP